MQDLAEKEESFDEENRNLKTEIEELKKQQKKR